MSEFGNIIIRGARQHNLKGVTVSIPRRRFTVVTGPSGSGKSSLAFDTLYAEGQRRYVETFSPYTRQFLERMDKPLVDQIEGIPPAIAIEQSNPVRTSRSTVGTMTEISDYMKLLFARKARLFCPQCHHEIKPWTAQEMVEKLLSDTALKGQEVVITFEVPFPKQVSFQEASEFIQAQGYLRILFHNKIKRVAEVKGAQWNGESLTVVQDRIQVHTENRKRIVEALEVALQLGKGIVAIRPIQSLTAPVLFSNRWFCPRDHLECSLPSPTLFSFNNPAGACAVCKGFGRTIDIDYDLVLPDRRKSIREGVVKPWQTGASRENQDDLIKASKRLGIPLDVPFNKLSKKHQQWVIEGEPRKASDKDENSGRWYGIKGYFKWLESRTYKMHVRVFLSRYRAYQKCAACEGTRFRPETLYWKLIPSPKKKEEASIVDVNRMSVWQALTFFKEIQSAGEKGKKGWLDDATVLLLKEITLRLGFLEEVGLGYLTLDRATRTLSGGELQRVNLTTCLGTSLVNTLFVLDEPSIGLHPRDTHRLIQTLRRLSMAGNTVVVVEHDEQVIRAADWLVDMGPGRGAEGGQVVFAGEAEQLFQSSDSLTADYLTGRKAIPIPAQRRKLDCKRAIQVRGARQNNLKGVNLSVPLGGLVCFTGVSGSGKSTLVHDVIYKNLLRVRGQPVEEPGVLDEIFDSELVSEMALVDQSPLSRTPRSNPILYVGGYDAIRELFAATEEALSNGLNASSFSFNSGNGRCERCGGMGYEKVEMQFLSDLFVKCPACEGQRFQPQVLKVHYADQTISNILEMTVAEGLKFFQKRSVEGNTAREKSNALAVVAGLELLDEVGLGYLRLGQPLNQLSGGESQRIKLVGHLMERLQTTRKKSGRKIDSSLGKLLILDEPTTGLHFDDIRGLIEVIQRLVAEGHSIWVIEHNLDVIKCADWVIELGPEGGDQGGKIVFEGTPEQMVASFDKNGKSHTALFLKEALHPSKRNGKKQKLVRSDQEKNLLHETPSSAGSIIQIQGARHHNLKNISVDIPLDAMSVVTGLSGSGKSTLAFDIVFAEGQRRYLDSLNTYARQFVQQMEKPDVDVIRGIPPTVAIEQRMTRGGGKSTVGTVTEVHHFIRLLFAKLGQQHDPDTGEPAIRQSAAQIQQQIFTALEKMSVQKAVLQVLAPLVKARKGFHTEIARWAERKNYPLLRVDGKWIEPAKFRALDRYREHTIDVMLGEMIRGKEGMETSAWQTLIAEALRIGKGTLYTVDYSGQQTIYSTSWFCPGSGRSFDELDPRLFSYNSPHGWCPRCQGYGTVLKSVSSDLFPISEEGTALEQELENEKQREWAEEGEEVICSECQGERLNPVARAVRLQERTIGEIAAMSVAETKHYFSEVKLKGRDLEIARDILPEIVQRLNFLEKVGLDYLQLNRSAKTLSGGESQRIRLAAQLGSNLEGVLYVLDEPTIGLHPRDNEQLLEILSSLQKRGNSLLIVEHDEETMRRADHLIDLGPGAGVHGGEVMAAGSWREIAKNTRSVTGLLLGQPLKHPSRGVRRLVKREEGFWLKITGCRANNLKRVTLELPTNRLNVLTGVSGSGKSTLMREVLMPAVQVNLQKVRGKRKSVTQEKWDKVEGTEIFSRVIEVDQSPIGKTSRSTPATYTGIFDQIRALFALLPEARARGYTAGRFSFNSKGGRCETCQGQGMVKVEMQFLPTLFVPCETCNGARYNRETLEIKYRDRSIAEVLEMSVEEAAPFFHAHPAIARSLKLFTEMGLGYLKLGQSSPTLSGGEAQRLKLVSELSRSESGHVLYLLEEPTIGLHLADVQKLLEVLHQLVDRGHTVVVIEHHLDVIAEADYVVDLGPEGGNAGGHIVTQGTPEQVADCKSSHTGKFLKQLLVTNEAKRRNPLLKGVPMDEL